MRALVLNCIMACSILWPWIGRDWAITPMLIVTQASDAKTSLKPNQKGLWVYNLLNSTSEDVYVYVSEKSCTCLSASLDRNKVQSGEAAILSATADLGDRASLQAWISISAESASGRSGLASIHVEATREEFGPGFVAIAPTSIRIGRHVDGALREYRLDIYIPDPDVASRYDVNTIRDRASFDSRSILIVRRENWRILGGAVAGTLVIVIDGELARSGEMLAELSFGELADIDRGSLRLVVE